MADQRVRVRFLLGPAGSGKTFRCLEETRAALRANPEGPPLLFLAPKQATFQIERQVLADAELPGYTRLHILSFERLAEWILRRCAAPMPPLLTEGGRVMVLRALLARNASEWSVFRATARLPGFARQLSEAVRELEQHNVAPERLRQVATQIDRRSPLRGKLLDLAAMATRYREWLAQRRLEDPTRLLRLASEAAEASAPATLARMCHRDATAAEASTPECGPPRAETQSRVWPEEPEEGNTLSGWSGSTMPPSFEPWFAELWLDGFAEMTPAELDLVAAVIPRCGRATLAFCVESPSPTPGEWLSPWSLVGRTQAALRERLARNRGLDLSNVCLSDPTSPTRFSTSRTLRHLERYWMNPRPLPPSEPGCEQSPLRLVRCANPEAEAITAARAVLRFVREERGRYREAAILVRSLDPYQAVIRRVFARYGIPIFLDRREGVAHHPLAELVRSALRLAAFGWRTEDWMSVLKTGLAGGDEQIVDALENAALASGWEGETWLKPLPSSIEARNLERLESFRCMLTPPFAALVGQLQNSGGAVNGTQFAEAFHRLWKALRIEATLDAWNEEAPDAAGASTAPAGGRIHGTVWQDLNALIDDLALAFRDDPLPLRDWLPIVEAGLSDLSVGVVPPTLDQVLVGAIDRSRNPDLKLVVLPGWNDGVFPAPMPAPGLLNESERRHLESNGVPLGPDRRRRIGRERYYAYIACTRARQRIVVTYAERDLEDRLLNPSPFLGPLRRLFPGLTEEAAVTRPGWDEIEHGTEAVVPLMRHARGESRTGSIQTNERLPGRLGELEVLDLAETIDPGEELPSRLADRLYGPEALRTSVTRLEQFAACPFRFFVHSGLRAEERQLLEADVRQTGSFQHEVLARFHAQIAKERKRWRDLTPSDARERVGQIAEAVAGEFAHGLFRTNARGRFAARALSRSLQDFVEVMIEWMRTSYGLDPVCAELVFGAVDSELPVWEVDLAEGQRLMLQGKIDRIDLARAEERADAWCVVVDYKSSARKVDAALMENGIQIQLPAYMAALRALNRKCPLFGCTRLAPAGVFYVNLRGGWTGIPNRTEAVVRSEAARRAPYVHRGRFDATALPVLDRLRDEPETSGQFLYSRGGKPSARHHDPLPAAEFAALLDRVEQTIRGIGRQIFNGVARVDPYAK
ncbi:MAG TPA: PD-(D/E)XK nuclease family protein, partial [Verrucomicrobiota bacterium]|nr:PD-(D/E)XK nuclease family protein [Verrucomicrobiota bacterium]